MQPIVQYEVEHRTGTNNWVAQTTQYITGAITGLTNGDLYDVRVRAVADSGDVSLWSPVATETPMLLVDPLIGIDDYMVSDSMDTRLWADVYDVMGNRLGDGPVTEIIDISTTSALDAISDWSLQIGLNDARSYLLLAERHVRVYAAWRGRRREVIHGIINIRAISDSTAGPSLLISGQSIEREVRHINTLPNRAFNNVGLKFMLDDLQSLLTDWTFMLDQRIGSQIVNMRHDATSVFRALTALQEHYGIHLRLYPDKRIYVSKLGRSSGFRLHRIEDLPPGGLKNASLLPVENINETTDSSKVYNRIYLQGGGEGSATLTLADSTRTSPYPIRSAIGTDGVAAYYIEDTASIARYGLIEKVTQFKDIAPINNFGSSIVAAADELYEAGVVYLNRYKEPVRRYSVRVRTQNLILRPGDTIDVNYVANLIVGGEKIPYLSVKGDFWIVRINETINHNGVGASLEIQNNDRQLHSAGEIVLSAVEQIDNRNLKPSTGTSGYIRDFQAMIDPNNDVEIPLEVTEATLYVQRVRLRMATKPLVTAIKSNGNINLESDASYPAMLRVFVNDVDRTMEMFETSTLVDSGAPLDVVYEGDEILDYLESATGGVNRLHKIKITSDGGRGQIEGSIELYQVMQDIPLISEHATAMVGVRPATPGNPRTTNITLTGFTSRWDVVAGASYVLEIVDHALQTTHPTVPVGTLFHVSSGLITNTIYQWRVAAVLNGLYSDYTAWQIVKLMRTTAGKLTWQGEYVTWQGEDLTWSG